MMVGLSLLSLLLGLAYCETFRECVSRNQILHFPDQDSKCCEGENAWLVKKSANTFSCEEKPCSLDRVWYEGKCNDALAEGVCGNGLGLRLYTGEDGEGYCDCMEGWMMVEGNCYQEFTTAPHLCQDDDYLLRFKEPTTDGMIFWPNLINIVTLHLSLNFSCIENPCQKGDQPHWETYDYDKEEGPCHRAPANHEDCELVLDYTNSYYNASDPDRGEPLKCCSPQNRPNCYVDKDDTLLTQLSVTPLLHTKKCRRGCYFSNITKRCQGIWPGRRCGRRRRRAKSRKSEEDTEESTTISK